MAATSGNDEEMIAGINVTPLVDVTLVLLIIFMVTTTVVVRRSIEVDLPRAASAGETAGTMLTLTLDAQGTLFVDGQPASRDAARAAVRTAMEKDRESRAIISADRTVSHGQVVELIDLVRGEGLTRFAVSVERVLPRT